MMWELEPALRIVRAIQPHTREFGYHLALGGGVLNKGQSEKDLDLYFLPMGTPDKKVDPDGMLSLLEKLWGTSEKISAEYDYPGMKQYAHAIKFTRLGGTNRDKHQRIDCFIFGASDGKSKHPLDSLSNYLDGHF